MNKLIAAVAAFDCLSFKQHGISENLVKDAELVKGLRTIVDGAVRKGNQLEFIGDGREEKLTLI